MLTLARRINRFNGLTSIEKLSGWRKFRTSRSPPACPGRKLWTHYGNPQPERQHHRHHRTVEISAARLRCAPPRSEWTFCISSARGCRRAKKRISGVSYRPLHDLLAQSDWVVPQLPTDPSTRHFIDGERLALISRARGPRSTCRAQKPWSAMLSSRRSARVISRILALDPLDEKPGRPMTVARVRQCDPDTAPRGIAAAIKWIAGH